jgi:hypothetical protein
MTREANALPSSEDRHTQPRSRLLLDTNVWAQLCDYDGRTKIRELYKAARAHGVQIVVAPPAVYEVMARPPVNPSAAVALRERAWVLSRSWWKREPSDAYLEAGEIFAIIARHRRVWLRRRRQDLLDYLANDWTKEYQYLPIAVAQEIASDRKISRQLMRTRAGNLVRLAGFWKRLETNPGDFADLMRGRQIELVPRQATFASLVA